MAWRPPSRLKVAWEDNRSPQRSRASPEPYETCMVQSLGIDASWLPVYEEEEAAVDFIQAFVSSPEKEERQKVEFLNCISTVCGTARERGLSRGLGIFCQSYKLAENIKVLLEEEPRDQLCTEVRLKAMLAIDELSSVTTVLEGKETSLLEACFSSVFLLPPKEEMQDLDTCLYSRTLKAMDTMLENLVLRLPASRVMRELQNILQVLLNFTNSERVNVRVVALERIVTLSCLLARKPTLEHWTQGKDNYDIQIPVLGQLLGRLLIFQSPKDATKSAAFNALLYLYDFVRKQESRSALRDQARRPHWRADAMYMWRFLTTREIIMNFAKFLQPCERTGIVLMAIEAMRDSSIFDKEAARSLLEVLMSDPDFWLADVPQIMTCIQRNLECITMQSARQSVESFLLLLTNQSPMQVVTRLLEVSPPGDSAAMTMWEVMLSIPQTLEILRELLRKLQGLPTSATEDARAPAVALTGSTDFQSEDLGDKSHGESCLRPPSLVRTSLFLRCLVTLSERPDTARKMQVLLPHVVEVLTHGNADIKMKALMVLGNVMGHLKGKEAIPFTAQLAEELLLLFDDESSRLRELSISFFRDLVGSGGRYRKRMKKYARSVLVPLFLRMSDQTDGVAKASGEALLAAAELLKWKELQRLVQTEQMWRIGECLLGQDGRRAEEFCRRSLPYLQDAQDPLREAAVRFIGLAARPLRRDQSREKLSEICSALRSLAEDSNASIRSLAAQTVLILDPPGVQQTSGPTLQALC